MNLYEKESEFIPDNLIAGSEVSLLVEEITIEKGQNLKRGSVLGVVTETGLCKQVKSDATDGSNVAYAILADDTDATEENKKASVYICGYFNSTALLLPSGEEIKTYKTDLRKLGIYVK